MMWGQEQTLMEQWRMMATHMTTSTNDNNILNTNNTMRLEMQSIMNSYIRKLLL